MKRALILVLSIMMILSTALPALASNVEPQFETIVLEESYILDHLMGGWIGQMAGVSWAAPTEFYASWHDPSVTILPMELVPEWKPETINDSFSQDDLYVDVTFLDTMKDNGPNADWTVFGEYFGNSQYRLWHANRWGRDNVRAGIPTPWSGHYTNTLHSDDIDWQIECDAVGMSALAQPEVAKDIAWRAGHVMNYGDGVYGGVYVATMYAAAFTANSLDELIATGMKAIPEGSQFWKVQNDVLQNYNAGMTWEENWYMLDAKWTNDRCPSGLYNPQFNIDAKMNSAYITMGLLYGEGDFEQSMLISMRCGQDSDCNPASIAGILGCYYGLEALDDKWKSGADWDETKFEYTDYTLTDCVNTTLAVARSIVELRGGEVKDGKWYIPVETAEKTIVLEQWPLDKEPVPVFERVLSTSVEEKVVHFYADAVTDILTFNTRLAPEIGEISYQWFFGDLTFADGQSVSHTYLEDGPYFVTCYASDGRGNTAWQQIEILVK